MANFYPDEINLQSTLDSSGLGDIVYLPNTIITTAFSVTTDCQIIGQENTIIDLTGVNELIGININSLNAEISNFKIKNKIEDGYIGIQVERASSINNIEISAYTGVLIENCSFVDFDSIIVDNINDPKGIGFDIKNSHHNEFINCEARHTTIGFNIQGDSSLLGDTNSTEDAPGSDVLEVERTNRSHNNNFINNISNDNNVGIQLLNSDHNIFQESQSFNNTIGIKQLISSYSNQFAGEIYNNSQYGANNTDKTGNLHTLDMRQVWWGHITGPAGAGQGQGNKISNYILYEPWLKSGTEPDLSYPVTRNWIWSMLGDPIIRVELSEEHITQDIEVAIEKYLYYWDPEPYYHYLPVNAGQSEVMLPLDIPKERVKEVIYQPHEDLFAQLSGSESSFFLTYYMQQTGGTFLADFYVAMAYKETFETTLGIRPSYEFVTHPQDNTQSYHPVTNPYRDFIRIYPKTDTSSVKLAIKVSRILTEEEVDSRMWIRKYALTWSKERLGQIRGKFQSIPGPTGEIGLKGSELIAEAQQDREALVRDLINRSEPLGFTTG